MPKPAVGDRDPPLEFAGLETLTLTVATKTKRSPGLRMSRDFQERRFGCMTGARRGKQLTEPF